MPDEAERIISAIADTIQTTYGDATQTVLDRRAARAIYQRITEMGMAPLSTVAAIIAAAGGKVTIPTDLLLDPPTEVVRVDDLGGITLHTRQPVASTAPDYREDGRYMAAELGDTPAAKES